MACVFWALFFHFKPLNNTEAFEVVTRAQSLFTLYIHDSMASVRPPPDRVAPFRPWPALLQMPTQRPLPLFRAATLADASRTHR